MRGEAFYARFGVALRFWRKKRRLTQSKLAESIDLSRASIANIERGSQRVSLFQFFKLCAVLRVDFHELLIPNEVEFEKANLKEILRKVPAKHRGAVAAVINPSNPE